MESNQHIQCFVNILFAEVARVQLAHASRHFNVFKTPNLSLLGTSIFCSQYRIRTYTIRFEDEHTIRYINRPKQKILESFNLIRGFRVSYSFSNTLPSSNLIRTAT